MLIYLVRSYCNCYRVLVLLVSFLGSDAWADSAMEHIREKGKLRVGLRADAFPFSYIDKDTGQYVGFSVDMAHLLTEYLSKRFQRPIRIQHVPVTANNRIDLIRKHVIDIEMGVTSINQKRESMVDFSLIYFISETTFLVHKKKNMATLSDLNGKTIGAARGTTNLEELNRLMTHGRLVPQAIVLLDTHIQGMKALKKGTIDAYCSDRILLDVMRRQDSKPEDWITFDIAVAYEPYAFMLPEGQSDFRDFLNDTIRWAISSGRFDDIYDRWMGPKSASPYKMPPALKEYMRVVVYPMAPSWWHKK